MKSSTNQMKPQDLLILLKIISENGQLWQQIPLAEALGMSQSEVSQSLNRSEYAGLLNKKTKSVMRLALLDFIHYGLSYVFPQKPGPVMRGIATAHSAEPLNRIFRSDDHYIWPSAKGKLKGHSIIPIYPTAPEAALKDPKLHQLLALTDVMRIGRAREKEIAINELSKMILHGEQNDQH